MPEGRSPWVRSSGRAISGRSELVRGGGRNLACSPVPHPSGASRAAQPIRAQELQRIELAEVRIAGREPWRAGFRDDTGERRAGGGGESTARGEPGRAGGGDDTGGLSFPHREGQE